MYKKDVRVLERFGSYSVDQRSTNIFCKEMESKYFWFGGTHIFSVMKSVIDSNYMNVYDCVPIKFIYKNRPLVIVSQTLL